jgi:hypothetical protein
VWEFLIVGGVTPAFFLASSWLLRRAFGLDASEYAVGFTMFCLAFVINDPHFAVTYLLFYRDARARALGGVFRPLQRARYVGAGFVAPVVLVAWAALAILRASAPALGFMIQLMFLLVGWHYVKQGFGVMSVLAARRGVRFDGRERAAILAHCYAGWAYAWSSPADPGSELEEKGLVYTSVAHPAALERAALAAVVASSIVLAAVLFRKWRVERRLPIVTPLVAMLCSVWTWSIYSSIDPLVRYVIPALHSIQYLYMVHMMKAGEAREREGPPWFEAASAARLGLLVAGAGGLGGVLFHGAPTLLDEALGPRRNAPTPLGPTPYFVAVYAIVNIHHYLMDAVIWRRDNPDTRYLRA